MDVGKKSNHDLARADNLSWKSSNADAASVWSAIHDETGEPKRQITPPEPALLAPKNDIAEVV